MDKGANHHFVRRAVHGGESPLLSIMGLAKRLRDALRGRGRVGRTARDRGSLSGRPEDLWRELIARHAPGRTFADAGCMWNVHGAYAFCALRSGAAAVTAIDIARATREFHDKNATRCSEPTLVHVRIS